jgi:hypothetical protein
MNYRTFLVIGVSILVVQGNAFAARPNKKRVTPRSSPVPAEVRSSAASRPAAEFPAINKSASAESDPEQVRYDQAKAKAKADPEVKALKAKADQATDDATARATSEAYNRTLFRKMKQLDRSISDRADLVEAAILRKIHESSLQ